MGIFDFLKGNRDSQSNKVLQTLLQPLDVAMDLASSQVEEKVKIWDLENPYLIVTLGYILGWIDAAYQTTRPKKYDEKLVESVFEEAIERYLSEVSGIEIHFELRAAGSSAGGSFIGGLQGEPMFSMGTQVGASDLGDFVSGKKTSCHFRCSDYLRATVSRVRIDA